MADPHDTTTHDPSRPVAALFLTIAAILGATGVMAGSFGAHGLEGSLSTEKLETFEVAVRYQLYHAPLLAVLAMLHYVRPRMWWTISGWLITFGTLLFSGCLYAWLFTDARPLMFIVPIGGSLLIAGWTVLGLSAWTLARGRTR